MVQLHSERINSRWEPVLPYMSDDEAEGFQDLLRFYSPQGVIRKASTYFRAGGSMPSYVGHGGYFDFEHLLRHLSGMSGLDTGTKRTLYGGGKGNTLFKMFASTLGEIIERVLGSLAFLQHADRLIFGSYKEMTAKGHRCIGPAELPLFAPEQHDQQGNFYDPFTEDTPLRWIKGQRLFSHDEVWMPAQVLMLFYLRRPDEAVICFGTSGGLATHINLKEALYHGIIELFERDAMNVSWYSKIPPEIVDFDRPITNPELRRQLEMAEELPGSVRFYLHALDTPELPTVTGIEVDPRLARYAYYSGAGVDPDIENALLSAFGEYGQSERNMRVALFAPNWRFSRALGHFFDVSPDADRRELNIFFKIVPYYGYPQNFHKLDWYINTKRHVPLSSLPSAGSSLDERWRRLGGLLNRTGIDPIVFDFTPPQMKHVKLTKVYIPELTPPCPPSDPLLAHRRYYELPRQLGLTDRDLTLSDLNTDPMPYP